METNRGKDLEKLVRIIEEVYKTNSETIIHSNYKLESNSSRKREIDIFIESNINGYSVKIAIECKEYKSRVSASVVESFNSKCLRIPEINKKIIVSKEGFQKEAVAAAKDFGIELYNFEEVEKNSEEIFFIPLKKFVPVLTGFTIESLDCCTDMVKEISEEIVNLKNLDYKIFVAESDTTYSFSEIIRQGLQPIWSVFGYSAFFHWLKNKNVIQTEPFVVKCEGVYFFYDKKKIYLNQIKGFVNFRCDEITVKTDNKVLLNSNNKNIKAFTQTFTDENKKLKGEIIIDKENNVHFFDSSNDAPVKLQVIAKYDPSTDKMDFF